MVKDKKALRRVHLGLGIALLTAGAAIAGCAAGEGAIDEASQAIDPVPPLPAGAIAACTMSGPTLTGRQWGALMPARRPGFAFRVRLGGEAPTYYRSCHDIASELGLQIVE